MTAKFKVFCFLIAFCLGFWTCEKTQSRQEGNDSGSESLKHRFMINFSEHFQPTSGITITDSALYHTGEGNLEIISNPLTSPFRFDYLNTGFTAKEHMTFEELESRIGIFISFSETGTSWSEWHKYILNHHETSFTEIRFRTRNWEGVPARGPFPKYYRLKVVSDESNQDQLIIQNMTVTMYTYGELSAEEKRLSAEREKEMEEDRKKYKWIFDEIRRKKKDQPD